MKHVFSIGIFAIMAIIAIFFFARVFTNEEKTDVYDFVVFVAVEIALILFRQQFQDRRILRNEKKEHAQHICKVYKLLTIVNIGQGRYQKPWKYFLKFSEEYKPFVGRSVEEILDGKSTMILYEDELKDYPAYNYYETALKHLEDRRYKHIYKHWKKIKNLLGEFNAKTSIEERLQDVIMEKMNRYFPALPNIASGTELLDHYNVDHIIKFMVDYFADRNKFSNYALDSLTYAADDTKLKCVYSEWIPNNFHIIMRSDGNLDFETYKKVVKEMQDDTSLKNLYNEFVDEYNNITKELTDFQDKLEELVKDLEINVPLKGKCKGCPS